MDSPALLSSPFILMALGYHGHLREYNVEGEESDRLRYWVLVANAKGRYSGVRARRFLIKTMAMLRSGGGAKALIDRLRQQVGGWISHAKNLKGAINGARFSRPCSWPSRPRRSRTGVPISPSPRAHKVSHHRLQFHHIFPKAILKSLYTGREADDIANLCFIAGKTNRQISDKAPSTYFPPMIDKSGPAAFDAQCIPTEPRLLAVEHYKSFVDARRRLVAQRLNAFLGG